MGAVVITMLRRRWLILVGIVLLVVTLFLPHGDTRDWLLVAALLLVLAQTALNAIAAQRGRPTPDS